VRAEEEGTEIVLEQVIRGADAGAPNSKTVWNRAFGMVWMGAVERRYCILLVDLM